MTDAAALFTRFLGSQTAATQEQKMMIDVLYNNSITLQMGDKSLNSITALTWNSGQCANIFRLFFESYYQILSNFKQMGHYYNIMCIDKFASIHTVSLHLTPPHFETVMCSFLC
jgi:hypothetical protein